MELDVELIFDGKQAIQQQGIKTTAFAVENHSNGFFLTVCLLIAAFAGQRIVNVGKGNDLRGNRNLVAAKPVRIAAAVVTLMMPAADIICNANQRFILMEGKALEDGRADGGMGFHHLKFLTRQPAGFIEDGIRYVDFADVMKGGSSADERNIVFRQRILVGLGDQLAKQ